MKAEQVEIGGVYVMKVTDKEAQVRIDREHENGGWIGTNLSTNRSVRIKSARKLRRKVQGAGDDAGVAETMQAVEKGNLAEGIEVPRRRAKKKLSKKEREALKAESKADQENARLRDEREDASDDMTASERAMAQSEPAKPEPRSKRSTKPKETGCLDAAAQVLEEAGEPLTCSQMMERILDQGLWTTTGRTPAATLYSAIAREIQRKGNESRFVLADRGKFKLNQ